MPPKKTPATDTDGILKELTLRSVAFASTLLGTDAVSIDHVETEFQARAKRMDYLAKTAVGTMIHVEFQSYEDPQMPPRMALYSLLLYFSFKDQGLEYDNIRHFVLNTGDRRMQGGPFHHDIFGVPVEYVTLDARTIDPGILLASPHWNDNVLALYCGGDLDLKIGKLRETYGWLPASERHDAERRLILAGASLRILDRINAGMQMAHLADIIKTDPLISSVVNEARQESRLEGKLEGKLEGRLEGKLEGKLEGRLEEVLSTLGLLLRARKWSSANATLDTAANLDLSETHQMLSTLINEPDISESEFAARFSLPNIAATSAVR